MNQTKQLPKITKQEAIEELWNRGYLRYKCHPVQKEMYDLFYKSGKNTISVWLLARQSGKSTLLALLALECALRNSNMIIKLVTDTKMHVKSIFEPIFTDLLNDCPEYLRPKYYTQHFHYMFPNGSQIQLAGSDGKHYEKLRGQKSNLVLIDEAGFCNDLDDMVYSVLLPTTTHTGGKIILATTPPLDLGHSFFRFMEEAEINGMFVKKTIYDNPLLSQAQIDRLIEQMGGVNNEKFRREYLCHIVKHAATSVIPEFAEELEKEIVKDWPRPPFFDAYVAMDIGFVDLTAVIFGYYDFKNDKIIIEDEIKFDFSERESHLKTLLDLIDQKEQQLWTNHLTNEVKRPYLRVSDINKIVTNELAVLSHGKITFMDTDKHDKEAALNHLRLLLSSKKIIINPRCKNLIRHLKNVRWASEKNKNTFARSPDNGHYDFCFTEKNQVLTKLGFKSIKNIRIGDEVLTHTGKFKRVLNIMERDYSGDVINIKANGIPEIQCTPEHRFFVGKVNKVRDLKRGLTGQLEISKDEWIPANNINLETRLISPIIETKNIIKLTNEMSFLYGYYVAEGSRGGNGHQIQFSGHKKEKNVIQILEKAILETYGKGHPGTSRRSLRRHKLGICKPREIKLRYYESKNDNGRNILVTQKELWKELEVLGTKLSKKFPDFLADLNFEQSLYMFCGYIFGDGHFSKSGLKFNTISTFIRDGCFILSRKLGLNGSTILTPKKQANLQYTSSFTIKDTINLLEMINERKDLKFIFEDKLIHNIKLNNISRLDSKYKRINKIEKTYFDGKVYNIEVEDDNSYVVNGVAVHNCDSITYLVRNIEFKKNPYPKNYDLNLRRDDAYFTEKFNQQTGTNRTHDILRSIYKLGDSSSAKPDGIFKTKKWRF